jgi:ribosomal protein L37E
MSLVPCRECGREVSTEAQTCPQCGVPFPTRRTAAPPVSSTPDSEGERAWQVMVARPFTENQELFRRSVLRASYPNSAETELDQLLHKDEVVVRLGLSQEEANVLMQQLHGTGLLSRKIALGRARQAGGRHQSVGSRTGRASSGEAPAGSDDRPSGLILCRACGKEVSALAVTCPHCGDRIRASRRPIEGMPTGEAILWALLCFPLGFVKLGQGVKWLVWLIVVVVTYGIGLVPMWVDYFMCNAKARTTGVLGPWEWFPRV